MTQEIIKEKFELKNINLILSTIKTVVVKVENSFKINGKYRGECVIPIEEVVIL